MHRLEIVHCCLAVVLVLSGCGPSWPARFPMGTRLYERPDHRYLGKVVGFDAARDFHNGTGPKAAILIEQPAGEGRIWGACETCAASLEVEKP